MPLRDRVSIDGGSGADAVRIRLAGRHSREQSFGSCGSQPSARRSSRQLSPRGNVVVQLGAPRLCRTSDQRGHALDMVDPTSDIVDPAYTEKNKVVRASSWSLPLSSSWSTNVQNLARTVKTVCVFFNTRRMQRRSPRSSPTPCRLVRSSSTPKGASRLYARRSCAY